MEIILNGAACQLAEASTIRALLDREGYAGRRVAVEVNGEIVPKSHHAEHRLDAGDRIEIVQAIGGG